MKTNAISKAMLAFVVVASTASVAYANPTPKETLGKALFFDTNLSVRPGLSCASCHSPEVAFSDPDKSRPVSDGVLPHRFGNRNSPVASYAAYSPTFHFDAEEGLYVGGQFWDGRAASLEEQAKGPFLNPLEMANPNQRVVARKLRRTKYARLFDEVYGPGSLDNVERAYDYMVDAIASFERTEQFSPFTSKYDYYLRGQTDLSDQEKRGLVLFMREDKGNCAACHTSQLGEDGSMPIFTDFTYDNLGVPRNPYNPFYRLPKRFNPKGFRYVDMGLAENPQVIAEDRVQKSLGKMKVPTLRNIAVTSPYMHNGYFKDLRSVVEFYNSRDVKPVCARKFTTEETALARNCWPVAEVEQNVNHDELGNLGLTENEIDDIVAFLQTLTDGYTP